MNMTHKMQKYYSLSKKNSSTKTLSNNKISCFVKLISKKNLITIATDKNIYTFAPVLKQ